MVESLRECAVQAAWVDKVSSNSIPPAGGGSLAAGGGTAEGAQAAWVE